MSICISRHPQLKTGGFRWSKVLLLALCIAMWSALQDHQLTQTLQNCYVCVTE